MSGSALGGMPARAAACIIVYLMLSSLPVCAGQTVRLSASITGRVTSLSGQALTGANVSLSSAKDGVEATKPLSATTTGSDGFYQLKGITPDQYRLHVAMSGYAESTSRIVDLAGGTAVVNFTLQPSAPTIPAGGFLDNDAKDGDTQHSFRTSGVEGATAPSGYSAGASAEDNNQVMSRVSKLNERELSFMPPAETIRGCDDASMLLKAAQAKPASFSANRELGVFYVQHSEMSRSIPYLAAASILEPNDLTSLRWLSLAYVETNQFQKAIDLIESSIKQKPDNAALLVLRARVYEASGDKSGSIAAYLSVASLSSDEDSVFVSGIGLASLGAAGEALRVFSAGLRVNPASVRLWMGQGIAQDLTQRKSEAARSLIRAAELQPDYLPTYLFLATLSGTSMQIDAEIRALLEALIVSNPQSAEAHYDYALAMWKHARLEPGTEMQRQIEEHLQLAITKDPQLAAAHLALGTVYEEAGDHVQAASELKRAVQLDPENPSAHYRLARAYRRANQLALADLELERFKKMRSAPPQDDNSAEDGLRIYMSKTPRLMSFATPCHEVH